MGCGHVMLKIDFTVPFSGFDSTTFVNCISSVYMYLENMVSKVENATFCNEWVNGQCNSCGNCLTKPQSLQERYFFLFDTMCGRSSLRWRFNGMPTQMEHLINNSGDNDDGGSPDNIDFLFGFIGYRYDTVTNPVEFKEKIVASVRENKPVIAKLKENSVPFSVIIGLDGDKVICPDFKCAQKSPDPEVTYDNIDTLYTIGDKMAPNIH